MSLWGGVKSRTLQDLALRGPLGEEMFPLIQQGKMGVDAEGQRGGESQATLPYL